MKMSDGITSVLVAAALAVAGWFALTVHNISVHAAANNERINELVVDMGDLKISMDVLRKNTDALGEAVDDLKDEVVHEEYAGL